MIPQLVNGDLPLGRWPVTSDELRSFADLPDAAHRRSILEEWTRLTGLVREAVEGPIAACWLSGSFFTNKERPGDIDCVYWVRRDVLQNVQDPDRRRFIGFVNRGGAKKMNMRVDGFIIEWWPRPGSHLGSAARKQGYLQSRGYWDDLWCRRKDPDLALDKLPRRGYLEVICDGYQ